MKQGCSKLQETALKLFENEFGIFDNKKWNKFVAKNNVQTSLYAIVFSLDLAFSQVSQVSQVSQSRIFNIVWCLEQVKKFVCGGVSGVRWGGCKPILVLRFGQAEQYDKFECVFSC